MTLKTTTWQGRNLEKLILTKDLAMKKKMTEPEIINFGPGGSVNFMVRYLPSGRKADLSLRQLGIRKFESLIRKTGLFKLNTVEPKEILRIFQELSPKKMYVYDREKKVIRAVERMVKNEVITVPVVATTKDMQKSSVDILGDIVVALNIVSRTRDKMSALANILFATKPGGLICINIQETPEGFKKVGHCIFERLS